MNRFIVLFVGAIAFSMGIGRFPTAPVHASVLTFDISDPDLYPGSEGFPEGVHIVEGAYTGYGNRINGPTDTHANGTTTFSYGEQGEGYTPNVTVEYGPFSLLTSGPELWRYDYGDLQRVMYQGSSSAKGDGTDYDYLDIVLTADEGYDVILHDFDLAGWFQTDYVIQSVTVFDGDPFPILTPENQIFEQTDVTVAGDGPTHTHIDFGGAPLRGPKLWLRIDASNLGALSENIGIDNIRFSQDVSTVPEPGTLATWVMGGLGVVVAGRRWARSRSRHMA